MGAAPTKFPEPTRIVSSHLHGTGSTRTGFPESRPAGTKSTRLRRGVSSRLAGTRPTRERRGVSSRLAGTRPTRLHHRDLLASGQHDYDASYQHQQICCNWNGGRHVGGQHMDPPQLAHEHPRMSDAHNVDGSKICPVLTSIGTGIAVGLIVKGAVPEINKQYDTHLKKHVDGALEHANKHIQNIHKSIPPPATTKKPPAVKNSSKPTNPTHSKATPATAKAPHADGACVVM